MIDYSALLYDPVYAEIGVLATMRTTAGEVTITVYDDTRSNPRTSGVADVRRRQSSGVVDVRSVEPAAYARIPELTANGITREAYKNAVLTFNGRSWTVRSFDLMGSPNGEDLGEVRFLLMAAEAANG